MASRRRTKNRTITGSISDVQRRIRYLENRPSPSRLGNYSVDEVNLAPRVVSTDKIMVQSITRQLISDSAVGSAQLDTDSVGSAEIAADAVGSSEIASDSVGTSELSIDAVIRENIFTDAVGNEEIASDAVGSSEISQDSVGFSELGIDAASQENIQTDGVGSLEIASDAVGSSEINADSVGFSELGVDAAGAENLQTDSVGNSEIATDAVGASEISADSVGASEIAPESITSAELAADSVGNSELAINAVSTENLQFGAVTNEKILASTITGTRIAAKTIQGNLHIQDSSILTEQIVNGQITTDKLAVGAVTNIRLGSDISASKITQGTLDGARIGGSSITVGKIASGTSIITNINPVSPLYESESAGTYGVTSTIGISVGTGSNQVASGNHTHSGGTVPAHTHSFIGGSITTASGSLSGHSHLGRDGSHLHGIQVTGIVGGVSTSSRMFKKDITDYEVNPKKILNLKLKRYKYKDLVDQDQKALNREWMYGYIAEEVLETGIEEIVAYNEKNQPIALNYGLLSTLAIELLKSQQAEIDFLKEEVQRLKDAK